MDCLTFSPADAGAFMTTGPHVLRLWRMHPETDALMVTDLTPKDNASQAVYTHHAWLQVGINVGIETGWGQYHTRHARSNAAYKIARLYATDGN